MQKWRWLSRKFDWLVRLCRTEVKRLAGRKIPDETCEGQPLLTENYCPNVPIDVAAVNCPKTTKSCCICEPMETAQSVRCDRQRLLAKKQRLVHHMVRFHKREATRVASNGSSKRNIVRLPFKKLGASRRKDHDLVHGTRNRKQRILLKSEWNRRHLERVVLEFHDKTVDTQANYISWSADKIQSARQLSPSRVLQREAMERG